MSETTAPYAPQRASTSRFLPVRGLRVHVRCWGDERLVAPGRPPLVMLHGWMDVGASFQFVVDALAAADGFERFVLAPDWRGFGLTEGPPVDSYWFPDYLADLDALLDLVAPGGMPVDLLGHSMGGNVAMSYAGLRPQRIRRLINLEGFGLPESRPERAPRRLLQWLDALKAPAAMKTYDSAADVAERLRLNNPRLDAGKAAWLAPHWARPDADGRWHVLGDPAHKRPNPVLYRRQEVLEAWKRISAPLLWMEGEATDVGRWWGSAYPREDFEARLAVVQQVERACLAGCGHMLHHEQPVAVALLLARFLTPDPREGI